MLVLHSHFFEYLRETLHKHALEVQTCLGTPGFDSFRKKWVIVFRPTVNPWQLLTALKACDWSVHIFGASASPGCNPPPAMSLSSTVHGGQHDTKHVTFELPLHAAFVADEIWGYILEPARAAFRSCYLLSTITQHKFYHSLWPHHLCISPGRRTTTDTRCPDDVAVSYTHLTLPTICSV